ncbi:MAG: hypothetical protein H6702_00315 [Myxococcales bacterium]|nr:hypothetical protein [Myxococcales bacterium]
MKKRTLGTLGALCAALAACGVRPPRAPSLTDGPAASASPDTGWARYSDRERIQAIHPGPGEVWALSDAGVVRWDRRTAAFAAETGAGAPSPAARALTVGDDLAVYVGLPDGLAVKTRAGWSHSAVGFLAGGVVALAPRRGGGVWVAGANGLGWFAEGRLHVVAPQVRVLAMERGPGGRLWAATQGRGVLAVRPDRIEMHGTAQGLCGDTVRHVSASPDGRVAAVCADGSFSLWNGSQWQRWGVRRMGAVRAVWPTAGGLAVHTATGWFRAEPSAVLTGLPAGADAAPRLIPLEAPRAATAATALAAPPPAVAAPPPPRPANPEDAPDGVALPPAVPMPQPLRPPPVVEAPLPIEPATLRGQAITPPVWTVQPWPALTGGPSTTAAAVEPDGTAWRADAYQGLTMTRGALVRRYSALTLAPGDAVPQLTGDGRGRVYWCDGIGAAWVFDGQRWAPLPMGGGGRITGLSVDARGELWVLAVLDPPSPAPPPLAGEPTPTPRRRAPLLRVLHGVGQGALQEVARVPVAADGVLRAGPPAVAPDGTLYTPLYEQRAEGARGLGLGVIPPTRERLVLWPGRLGYDGEGLDGPPVLPDAWVNAVTVGVDGAVWVATNGGLARQRGNQSTVFDENAFIDSEVILALAGDRSGRVWAGTFEGLGRLAGDQWSAVRPEGLRGPVHTIHLDSVGTLRVGAEHGLWVLKSEREGWTRLDVDGRPDPGPVRSVWASPQGDLWLTTAQGLLRRAP